MEEIAKLQKGLYDLQETNKTLRYLLDQERAGDDVFRILNECDITEHII